MMAYVDSRTRDITRDIVSMPRGGPDASWLDRRLQTNRLEYLDRDDVDELKRKVVRSLDRSGRRRWLGTHHERCARTAIDAPDGYYDLAVFALSLHHLLPELAARVFAEGTRAVNKLFIIDLRRPPAPLHLVVLAAVLPFTGLVPLIHDGFISSLRAYSPSALRALAHYADPAITVEFRTQRLGPIMAVASRAREP